MSFDKLLFLYNKAELDFGMFMAYRLVSECFFTLIALSPMPLNVGLAKKY